VYFRRKKDMERTIRWGILGTGWIARKFADGLKHVPNATLYAISSRSKATADSFAREYNIPVSYGSYEAMAQDANIDVVYVATPHNLHCENTLMCLENGRNVLCEKPFAVNGKEVRMMLEKARQKDAFLMEAMWSKFLPHIIKTKELIAQGVIGEVKFMKCDFGINTPFDASHRHFNRELIGGSLLDIGIYPVFLSTYLFGQPDSFKAVAGIGQTEVDYNCSMTFKYPNELISVLYSSVVAKTDVVAEIYGTKGKIIMDEWWFTPVNAYIVDISGRKQKIDVEAEGNGYNYEAIEVGKCLRAGKKQSDIMSWQDSTELIDLLDAIRKECGIVYPGHD
jgi:scyllo-inositol 2-dehydrogenase (NADP+)